MGTVPRPEDRVALPAKFSDGYVVSALYRISGDTARHSLSACNLQPVVLPGDCSIAVITMFDYGRTAIGPYREISVGVAASATATSLRLAFRVLTTQLGLGTWVLALPVDSELARDAGRNLFGYPKFLARIDVDRKPDVCRCNVSENGVDAVALRYSLGRGPRVKLRSLTTYSVLSGALIETEIPIAWDAVVAPPGRTSIEILNQDARLARAISSLHLPPKPLMVMYGGGFGATLRAGRVLWGVPASSSGTI